MALGSGNDSADQVRREASAWIARMHGPDADGSRLAFERWRAASPRHRLVYAEMEGIARGTRQLGASPLGYHGLPQRRSLFARPAFRLAVAGIVMLLVAGTAFLLELSDRGAAPGTGEQVIASATGQLRRLRLPDGSAVILDTDTRIELAYSKTARLVRLVRGRARFDVAPSTGLPFMVEAGDRMILDRGTVFDVAIGREGVGVALLRGAVEVRDRVAAGRPGRLVARLGPGQIAVAPVGRDDVPVRRAPTGAERWVDGVLSYDGARLGDVVADLGRYSAHRVVLADPALAELRVTGVFRAVPAESAARALAAALGLKLASGGNGAMILSR